MPEPTQSVVSQLDPTTPVVAASPDQPTVTPAAPMTTTPLSEDTRERTRVQFEKLIDSNKRLFESNQALMKEIQQRNQSTQTFAPIQNVPSTTNQPTRVNPQDFIETDPTTGESVVNVEKMKTHIAEINQKASRVEQAMESYIKSAESREIDRQNKEAFTTYPELNPKDEKTFNQSFNKQVRGVLIDSMYNADDYGGRPLTFKEAAILLRYRHKHNSRHQRLMRKKQKKRLRKPLKKLRNSNSKAQPKFHLNQVIHLHQLTMQNYRS